jgi:glycosyltransferase involved in cell wall biosynthesis
MRILNVIMCLDPIAGGGSVERVYQLSKYLSLAGEDCTILTTKQGWNEQHVRNLGRVKIVALPYLTERFKVPVGLCRWLRRNLSDYEIVHLALNWTMITAITYVYLRAFKRPYIYSAMGWLRIDGRSKFLKRIYRVLFTKPITRHARWCVAVSKREVGDYLNIGVPAARIVLIPNGIGDDAFSIDGNDNAFRTHHGIDSRQLILFIGRLNRIKGADLLIQAFAGIADKFPNYQLVIAGNASVFLDELKRLARLFNVDQKITFLGPILGAEKRSAYRTAALFVIPSRFDTMTIVALEAAASSTPVLLTKQCDFDELEQAGAGLAVEATVEGLEQGLSELLANPHHLRAMGRRGKEFVLRTYHWNQICAQFIEIFNKSLAGVSAQT